jgi:hypothetical protein
MDEDEKLSGYTGIWDKANEARDIHFALLLALASAALTDGWEALRPHIASAKQSEPEREPAAAADRKKAAAS